MDIKSLMYLVFILIIEVITLVMFKFKNNVIFSILLYSLIGYFLRDIIHDKGLTIGHAFYDFSSVIIISLVGIFYFKEKVTKRQIIGLLLGVVSVYLLDKPHSH